MAKTPKHTLKAADAESRTQAVLSRVANERRAQDSRFGDHAGLTNTPEGERDFWRAFQEELGEHSRARLENAPKRHQLHELVQAIAVLVAWAEVLEDES